MNKQQIYRIVKMVHQLRLYVYDNPTSLNELRIGERLQLKDLKDTIPLIHIVKKLEEYFKNQNAFLSLVRIYVHRRLIVADDECHHELLLREESRIDKALQYIASSFPTILNPRRSFTKSIAA